MIRQLVDNTKAVIMWPLDIVHAVIHRVLDYFLSWAHLTQNSPVGWVSRDRKTGRIEREHQPIYKKLKLLLLFNPLTEWVDTTQTMRLHAYKESVSAGDLEGTPSSHNQIRSFVDTYGINMDDFEPSDIGKYATFEDFFTRKHRPGSRPIYKPNDRSAAVVVADSRVVTYHDFDMARKLWVKGNDFCVPNLIMDRQLARTFDGGSVASFRLSPQDYHRYHSPVSGTVKRYRSMPGDYYQVDPVALHSGVDILTRNRRDYVVIKSEEFGYVLFVAIGATEVGSVQIHEKWQKTGGFIEKGDELGYFQFGGSSIVVVFQKGMIQFDQDLLDSSEEQIQVSVDVGMSLGRAVNRDGAAK